MEKLSGEDLRITAPCPGESAAGLGQWAPGDLKLLSSMAYETLADLLNLVEEGADWLEQMGSARAAFQKTQRTC